jgi:ATP-binding cassette subfamily F protein 3
MAQYKSKNTVLDDFMAAFPADTEREARSSLGAFLFTGEDVFKTVDVLSGGERVRLALCKIFRKKPNFLILDEPTNHMDIVGKETLEEILKNYLGTVIFVSHDRYFIKQIADCILSFDGGCTHFYQFGYEEYLEKSVLHQTETQTIVKETKTEKGKKGFTTPLKEKAKRERAIKKAEERIALLEEEIAAIESELQRQENISDYVKLAELQDKQFNLENELLSAMEEWEKLSNEAQNDL